ISLYNKKWGIWFFAAAILMDVSRIVAGVHFPSDILGGAMLGIAVGYLVIPSAQKRQLQETNKPL
ncbi:phosphatase PAP2 family protein, partial [Patescibacteria group bacterium]|nr:phosphatase PAP2 family protein [Patescibacteria group bacterium]